MSRRYTLTYGLIGIFFGIAFPVIATTIVVVQHNVSFWNAQLEYGTLLWIIDTAPIFLGTVASIAGWKQDQIVNLNNQIKNQLQNTQTELFEVFKNSLNEIYIFEKETLNFIFANQSALDNLGYSMSELQKLTPIDLKPEFDRNSFREFLQPLNSGKKKTLKFLTLHKRKDGTTYPADVHLQISHRDEKTVYQAVILDQTENVKLQKELLHALKLSAIGELAAGVGHEINNPLTVISGNLEKIRKKLIATQDDNLNSSIEKISLSINRIKTIVNGLRTFSRPDIDEFEEINLKFAIDQTIDLISEIYKKEGINIAIDNISDEIVFKGTIGKFQQILMNLLSNAKDALENAKNPKIEVKTEVQDNFIKVHVIDNGDGISKEHGEKIFNAFYTTKGFGSGTGMGLSISSNLAKDIGGKLEFYSELGTGTKFTILLPVASESRFIATKIDVKNVSDQRTLNDSIKNILVVDDEEDIREILVEILSENNCNVVEANNGKQALDKIANNSFDLIITDIKMPIMDGIELIKNIRNMKQIIQPIIVASTGGATNLDTVIHSETSNHFVDGYLLKPFSIDEIPISLNDIIEKFNSKKEKRSA